ncbi:hypothetical protein C3747_1g1839c [Trypanosoma cruzi]|uniref:Uncharacterized protein n=2 Tax=Trypanosoma cruzi TaxID=5693 RepID=Q4DCL2_TRYCC|nr:hypothetical protein, conserved [Trypanosoma cruzi]EAN90271.1 hypothetical protein, conserved [Trypanosoma cruzi]PWV22232.1 hypothetical protein C3747_1g1839c [Trypanosoma cruzi]RNC45680.1 hypothetical protein TcCL_NonESM04568 [Trypanosoma cruzi]|eukprot:XP_812122.1 hypothetical protein [Trypanosoma cruzi strain CL Brener]
MGGQTGVDGACDVPQFGWYRPCYLPSRDPPKSTFPPLSKVVVSERLDGNVSDEEALKRRAELGFAWERMRPITEVWHGPTIDDKVPPAKDYERLLLDASSGSLR